MSPSIIRKNMGFMMGVVGGGIIGLAIAHKLQLRYPDRKVVLFEKEIELGQHQSGRNSGVLHCGLYYQPGSLKARLAVAGIRQMTAFCRDHNITHEICGKIVVASDDREVGYLKNLAQRGKDNGLTELKFLSARELALREPFVAAREALLVPEEGIVDYKQVMICLSRLIRERGGQIHHSTEITGVREKKHSLVVTNGKASWELGLLVNCAGLHADRLYARFTDKKRPLRIIPFRGEYRVLKPEAGNLVNHLVYPVPDPEYPFLGVHFTRMVSGAKEVGPNAVIAFKREGYSNRQFSLRDTLDALTYRGFHRFLASNFSFSMGELNSSLFQEAFLKKARKLVPDIRAIDFERGSAGVRAQAMDNGGNLIMDFRVERQGRQVHVLNAPSPGATASLAIADYIIMHYLN